MAGGRKFYCYDYFEKILRLLQTKKMKYLFSEKKVLNHYF